MIMSQEYRIINSMNFKHPGISKITQEISYLDLHVSMFVTFQSS